MRILIKFIILLSVLTQVSCDENFNGLDNCTKINGSGTIETRTLELSTDISEIVLNLPAEFEITSGTTQEIIIEGHPNVLDLIESESSVSGNRWKILNQNFCIDSDETKIYAQLISLESFEVNGVADVKSVGTLDNIFETLNLELNGAGKMELDFTNNKNVNIDVAGAGEIILSGVTENTEIDVDGASKIKLEELETNSCDIDIKGASDIEVNVLTDLSVVIAGAGNVCYKGSPTVTLDISGGGNVTDCN